MLNRVELNDCSNDDDDNDEDDERNLEDFFLSHIQIYQSKRLLAFISEPCK